MKAGEGCFVYVGPTIEASAKATLTTATISGGGSLTTKGH